MFNNITFILNKPQLSENIGACARAMKNFNFSKLVLINPKPSFPNDKIIATSVGAKEIIKKAKNYSDLKPVLNNIDYLISTTSRFRNKNIKHIELKDLKKIDLTKKIAFLFGAEASGLSNKDISYSNYVLKIPCNPNFKSLNLSHSLILVAQNIFNLLNQNNIKYFALHQASKYVCEKIREKINLDKKYFLNNFHKFGNTVSSSIPLLLQEAMERKKLKKNDTIIACGFGVGLSWGVVEIKW